MTRPDAVHAEAMFELLGATVDTVPPEQVPLFLAKLALMLALCTDDPALVREMADAAAKDLTRAEETP